MRTSFRENPFPYLVSGIERLPESFRQVVQHWLNPDNPAVSVLILPPQPFLKRGGIPRQAFISTTRGILYVRDGQPPFGVYLPGEALLYARHSLILLYGCLELVGETNGKLNRIALEYHTIGEPLIEAALRRFLNLAYIRQTESTQYPETEVLLDRLKSEAFKFMNGLRLHALQPGERLFGYVFQPRITQPFLRFFSRPVAPAALLALSDRALILIEEDKAQGAAYGWIVTICPRRYIAEIKSTPRQELHELSICLMRNAARDERKVILEEDAAHAWEILWAGQK